MDRDGPTAHDLGDAPSILPIEEARLFARAADGDADAVSQVWRANRRWIASVLMAHAPRGVEVDDLLQEVAATLVAKARHLRDAANLRGWLRVVAVNAARMAARDRSIERRALDAQSRHADRARGARDGAMDDAEEVLALVAQLPPQYAEPLLLQAGQGLSQRQIAEALDVPETTVETRLARARRMLRELRRASEEGVARRTNSGGEGGARWTR